MKERPILFSAPMVRAILEGCKTQTRRAVKPQPVSQGVKSFGEAWEWNVGGKGWFSGVTSDQITDPNYGLNKSLPCPYGKPGDRLWVRETFGVWRKTSYECYDFEVGKEATRGLTLSQHEAEYGHSDLLFTYRADGDDEYPWYPSIHMPRWASRITLEITDVRVERLQDMSEEDAIAEGVERWVVGEGWREYGLSAADEAVCGPPMPTARDSYRTLWDTINGEGAWDKNPWVWAVSFRRVEVR